MDTLLQSFTDHIRESGLFCPADRILLAVSGGVDSVVMTDLFAKAGYTFGIAHCNFHLRGSDSDSDEAFVRSLAEKYQVPVYCIGFDTTAFAKEHNLYVIEDNAQAIGAEYTFSDGHKAKTGTMGTIGCTSFFPSKNLGCYGDGGAIFTKDEKLAERIHMIANHGQRVKYHHSVIGCNSRLDSIQAAILDVKLKHLDEYGKARYEAASYYTKQLKAFDPEEKFYITPKELPNSTHVYHQYTLKIKNIKRDELKAYLAEQGIPSMIYYPLPLQEQEAFKPITRAAESLDKSKECAYSVLSLPIHTEMTEAIQDTVINAVKEFYK